MQPLFAVVDESTIAALVDRFYAAVRQDEHLGPVFDAAIAPDAWPIHLTKMYAFWSSVMLSTGRYKGNPVVVHQGVDGLAPELFGHWLELFEAAALELFVPSIAQEFAVRARRIAESLKLALFFRPNQPWTDDLRDRPPLDA